MADTLSDVIADHADAVVDWGVSDCLHFALAGAAAAGGVDLSDRVPRYRTRIGALRALSRMGFRTLADALDAFARPVPSSRARPGDIAMLRDAERIGACGVVIGADALFFGSGRLTRVPVRGLRVWRAC